MKRAPKVRWYPYWVLPAGIFCLLAACVHFFVIRDIANEEGIVFRTGPKSGPGSNIALAIGAGLLLTGMGAYAIITEKD